MSAQPRVSDVSAFGPGCNTRQPQPHSNCHCAGCERLVVKQCPYEYPHCMSAVLPLTSPRLLFWCCNLPLSVPQEASEKVKSCEAHLADSSQQMTHLHECNQQLDDKLVKQQQAAEVRDRPASPLGVLRGLLGTADAGRCRQRSRMSVALMFDKRAGVQDARLGTPAHICAVTSPNCDHACIYEAAHNQCACCMSSVLPLTIIPQPFPLPPSCLPLPPGGQAGAGCLQGTAGRQQQQAG